MTETARWLDDRESHLWRTWMKVEAQLGATLQRDLQAGSGLSMSDFAVLVHLTDDPQGQLRASDLATLLHWDRSRLSHHVKRMAGRGFVERRDCTEDGRGSFVAVTAEGRTAIEQAAPGHVASVRRLVFDVLRPEQLVALTDVMDTLAVELDRDTVAGQPCDGTDDAPGA